MWLPSKEIYVTSLVGSFRDVIFLHIHIVITISIVIMRKAKNTFIISNILIVIDIIY